MMKDKQPKLNMYGCHPCVECGGEHRYPTQSGTIRCDDCGMEEWS